MKSIDQEIFELEQRLHLREARIKHTTREVKQRTVKVLLSPVSIVGAVVLGFVVAGGVGRRRAHKGQAVSQETKEQSKGFALGSVLMTGVMWFVKQQFGGPVGLAHYVISKIKNRNPSVRNTPAYVP